ncbi:hypothetical protein B0H14DRAFT_3882859 [Mycena olivaceomarginata]|nr:hypothetical protein B0H14DRAFT_3882859 [Mycena olivaceomarginata]
MSYSTPMQPLSDPSNPRPSLEISSCSTMFQQWDLASGEASPASRRESHSDYSSGSPMPPSNLEFDTPPHARQRTTQACDKCRDRKTKCSGDHPVCKRCTARGLICHYSERERVRGPAKARLRNAMSSSSLDLRFVGDAHSPVTRREDLGLSFSYTPEYLANPQSPQHPAFPTQRQSPYSQPSSQSGSPAFEPPQLPNMSLPQAVATHRRVQSHSSLGVGDVYRHPLPFGSRPTGLVMSRLAPSSALEFDMGIANRGQIYHFQDDGASSSSEPPSASASVFSAENLSHSSRSSESSTLPEPLSRSASELDLRMMNQVAQYPHHQRLCNSVDAGKGEPARLGLHSPAASIHSFNELSSRRLGPGDIAVPPINEKFGDPWREAQRIAVQEVKLMYPTPITPITLGSDAIDMMARGGVHFAYDYADHAPPDPHRGISN